MKRGLLRREPRNKKGAVDHMHHLTEIEIAEAYRTPQGACYIADALDLLGELKDGSVDLIMTSPPFALKSKKEYGNVHADEYVEWFQPFAKEFHRVLSDSGSLVLTETIPRKMS
jgi:hypothetical protein